MEAFKLLFRIPKSHTGVSASSPVPSVSNLASSWCVQWEAASTVVPEMHRGDPGGGLVFWLLPALVQPLTSIWGMSQRLEDLLLCLCAYHII